MVPLPVAAVCLGVQVTALLSNMFLAVDPRKFMPLATQYFGRLTFLTVQSNILMTAYYAAVLGAVLSHENTSAQEELLVRLFPLCFSLGTFLTVAYYALDHFNPENVKKRAAFAKTGYPYVEIASHLEHGLALPAVLLFTYNLDVDIPGPQVEDILRYVVGYVGFYLAFTHVNKFMTGVWVYPIIEDVSKAAGHLGRTVFLLALVCVFVAFAFLGKFLLESRRL